DHDAGEGAAVPIGGCGLKQVALLLHARKLSVALVDDHIHERVAHLLRRDLAQVLPLLAALVRAELDVVGFDGAIERVEVKRLDVIAVNADFLAPLVEQPFPLTEASDFCNFSWYRLKILSPPRRRTPRKPF